MCKSFNEVRSTSSDDNVDDYEWNVNDEEESKNNVKQK